MPHLWWILLVLLVSPVHAITLQVAPGDSLTSAIAALHAGDTIHLASGVYTQGMTFGSTASQVRIEGDNGAILRPSGCTILGFTGAHHVTVSGLTLDGSHLACGHQTTNGVSLNAPSHHITLDGVVVRNVSNNGGRTSLGIASHISDVTLRNVTVDGTHINAGDFQGSHCLYLAAPGDRNWVIGGTFANCGGWGIQLNDSPGRGEGGNSGGLVQGSTVVGNGRRTTGGGGGIVLNNNIHTTLVRGNTVRNQAKGCGIDVWGGNNHDNLIIGNTLTGNPAGCICVGMTHAVGTILQGNHCDTADGIHLGQGAVSTQVNPPGGIPGLGAWDPPGGGGGVAGGLPVPTHLRLLAVP
jgi:hypothetical protein